MKSKSEEELAKLMRSACAGEQGQYHLLLQSISPLIRGIIHAKAGGISLADQEDLLQEILLAIHHKKSSWRQDMPLKPWIFAITRYKIIDHFRASGRHIMVDIDEIAETLAEEAKGQYVDTQMDVKTLVGLLESKQGDIVKSIGLEGNSIQETAKNMNMKETAIRVNFHRGLEKLKKMGQKLRQEKE